MGILAGDKALTREQRFWRRVVKTDGCWNWTGGLNGPGMYGVFTGADGRRTTAHRVAYELSVRAIPEGRETYYAPRKAAA